MQTQIMSSSDSLSKHNVPMPNDLALLLMGWLSLTVDGATFGAVIAQLSRAKAHGYRSLGHPGMCIMANGTL